MYVRIVAVSKLSESKGKMSEAWGPPAFENVTFENGKPGIQITCNDNPMMILDPRLTEREATVLLDQNDVSRLVQVLLAWHGLVVDENTALEFIQRLASDMLISKHGGAPNAASSDEP